MLAYKYVGYICMSCGEKTVYSVEYGRSQLD